MSIGGIIEYSLTTNAGLIQMALDGLKDEDLMKRPNDQTNPIGWLLWHQTRVEDAVVSGLTGESQVWAEEEWTAKFGMEVDPKNTGTGHSLEQVMALKPTMEGLRGYAAAVREKTFAYLKGLKPADLDTEVPTILGDTKRLGDYLGGFMTDHLHHSGQICYLRGYLTGFGWFPM